MKRYRKLLIPILFSLFLIMSYFTVQLITHIQSYGKLINYVGIVRGATQRLVKLELTNQPNDDLLIYLDNILLELNTGNGEYGLPLLDDPIYNKCLSDVTSTWEILKDEIMQVRNGKDPTALISISESYFSLANTTVFAAETYSNTQTKNLAFFIFFMVLAIIITWFGLLLYNFRALLHLEKDNHSLSTQIYTDPLTGAPTFDKFLLDTEQLLSVNVDLHYAVLYIDFENFKYVNDVFGYSYGDKMLKQYASLLKASIDAKETYCRISADNFLVLRHYEDKDSLSRLQADVDNQMSLLVSDEKEKNVLSVYCGICCIEDLISQFDTKVLIERANYAKKSVKNQPFNRYAYYNEEIRNRILAEKEIERRMHTALEEDEFLVYLQPKVLLETEEIACAEALVRWNTPDRGMISPGEFIPIFEKNLFIVQLDQYVFHKVCQWLRHRLDNGLRIIPVSVNVSLMQLYDPRFVDVYTSLKKKYQIPDGILEVEFTESVVFENMTVLLQIVAQLKQAGFLCSLDDFGKGYSSLNLLKSLPVDVLKLDALFFDESEDIEKARTVVSGIIAMVRKLHITIVAEGIEEKPQVEFLKSIGCDMVQGYVFYRPMPLKEIEELLL